MVSVHGVLATGLKECLETGDVPGWLVEERTILVMKGSKKGAEVGNYRLETNCLPQLDM